MAEIGVVYATLALSAAGVSRQVSQQMGDAGTAGGRSASRGFVSGIGGALGSVTKVAAGAVGIVGGLLGGIAIKGGISRALAIENAQAKLTGLGHSTKTVEGIMQNAMNSVKGTAFGLGDAAGVAAGAVAAGIAPGKDLERTLKLTGDAATIAGVGMNEMGAIFNKVAASNKIQGDVIAQLNDAGIPIVQLLGKELGKSAEETLKLASDGKIGFDTFQKAMEAGLGGAALKSGETFTGALANVKAALGRIGATALTPVLGLLKVAFNGLIPVFDGVNAAIKPVMETFTKSFGPKIATMITNSLGAVSGLIKEVTGGFRAMGAAFKAGDGDITSAGLAGFMEQIGAWARTAWDAIQPLMTGFNALTGAIGGLLAGSLGGLLSKLPIVGGAFAGLSGPVGLVVGAIAGLITQSKPLRDALGGALETIIGTISDTLSTLAPLIGSLMGSLNKALGSIGDALAPVITALVGAFASLMPVIAELVANLLPPLLDIFNAVIPVVAEIIAALAPLITLIVSALIPIIKALLPVITVVFGEIAKIISAAMTYVSAIIKVITAVIAGDWSGAWEGIKVAFGLMWDLVKQIVSSALAIVKSYISAALGFIQKNFGGVFSAIGTFVATIWNNIASTISNAVNRVKTLISLGWQSVKNTTQNLWNGIVSWIGGIPGRIFGGLNSLSQLGTKIGLWILQAKNAAIGKFNELVSWVGGLPGRLVSGLSNLGSLFAGVGRNMIQGMINGVSGMVNNAVQAVKNVGGSMLAGVKGFLGIKSPSRVFRYQVGQMVGAGFALGIGDMAGDVSKASAELMDIPSSYALQSSVRVQPAPRFEGNIGGQGAGAGVQIHQTINPSEGMSERTLGTIAAKELMWAL